MKNTEIIKSIKANEEAGVNALADKYGITREQAERIAETIVKRNAKSIRKMNDKVTGGTKILVGWSGRGFMGSFDTSTEFCFSASGDMFGIFGD